MMLQNARVSFDGPSGLEPVALRIARINEELVELQDMLEVAMRNMDSQQAQAALELQRLRVRLLDGLCPAKLRQSERVKRLGTRLARLEQNVGREQAECVRVMEAVLATVERNGAVAEAVCHHLGTRRAFGHGNRDGVGHQGIRPVSGKVSPEQSEARQAEPSHWSIGRSQVIEEPQGDAGVVIEEAMQAMQKMLESLERHTETSPDDDLAGAYPHTGSSGGALSTARAPAETQGGVQFSSADVQAQAEEPELEQKDAVGENSELQPATDDAEGVQNDDESAQPNGADMMQRDVPALPALNPIRGSEDVPPTPGRNDALAPAPGEAQPGAGRSSLEASEDSSSGTSPAEDFVKRVSSSEAGSSSSSSGEIERE